MTNLNFKLKVAVCGSKSVGKSAITVRYLTKRFISEYNSSREHLYKQTVQFEDSVLAEIEIMDTICASSNAINLDFMRWADCFLLVYSVIDRDSFFEVERILHQLSKVKVPSYYSTMVVGNKCDMENHRVVKTEEAQSLCSLYNAQYAEVSAADGFTDINSAFQLLLRESRTSSIQRNLPIRRKIGVNSVSKALGNIFGKNNKNDRKRPSLSI